MTKIEKQFSEYSSSYTQPEQASWNKVEIPISGNQKSPEPLVTRIKQISPIIKSHNLSNAPQRIRLWRD